MRKNVFTTISDLTRSCTVALEKDGSKASK
jgi:hypothetical protein